MKQKLGQNFLIDKNIAKLEVDYADINSDDVVLEIGPGHGILTELLAEKAKTVIGIEIDKKLIIKLRLSMPDNVELLQADALKVDLEKIPRFNKIVSNLPYQISSPITFKLLNYNFSSAVLIYQKEFADRLVASPGSKDYSRLSVGVYYKANCELLRNVPNTCFEPRPKVDSSIIRLTPRTKAPFKIIDEKFFFDLIKYLFTYRRKKIKNTLDNFYDFSLKDVPYLDERVEDLTPEQIGELSNILFEQNKN
jgi:16S rRNA (adenine1518-N6/adenine1519-N6)-dimethyltransferase